MSQTEREAQRRAEAAERAAAAKARRAAAQVLREKARAAKMAARAEVLAARAEARGAAQEDLGGLRRKAAEARSVARAMRESDRRTNQQVLGAVLLAIGGNWLLAEFGLFTFGWPGLFAVALMTLGVAMVSTAKAGRTKPLIALGIVLTLGLAMSSGVSGPVRGSFIGDGQHSPQTVEELPSVYEQGIGDLVLDLSGLDLADLTEPAEVRASLGLGDLVVILPTDAAVDIRAGVGWAGEISALGHESSGLRPELNRRSGPRPSALNLNLDISTFGDITVERKP